MISKGVKILILSFFVSPLPLGLSASLTRISIFSFSNNSPIGIGIIAYLTFNIRANGFPSLDNARVNGKAGETVRVPITPNSASRYEIAAVSIDISHDSGVLENPTAEVGPAGTVAGKDVVFDEISPGILRVGAWGMNQNVIGDGIVAYVTYDIKANAVRGLTALTNASAASDPYGNDAPIHETNGVVYVNMANTAPWLILLLYY